MILLGCGWSRELLWIPNYQPVQWVGLMGWANGLTHPVLMGIKTSPWSDPLGYHWPQQQWDGLPNNPVGCQLLNQVVDNELFRDLRWRGVEGWRILFWKPDWTVRLNRFNLNPDISPILKSTKLGNRSNCDKPWGLLNAGTELIGLRGNAPPPPPLNFEKKINSIYSYLIFSNLTE